MTTAVAHEQHETGSGAEEVRQAGEQLRLEIERARRRTASRERRVARNAYELAALLRERPELGRACPRAAFAVDAVRWSV